MLAIKLQRIGKKRQPSYRVVVAEKRSKSGGPPVEDIGIYNPFTKAMNVQKERVAYWIKNGARPTISAHNLLVRAGALSGKKIAVKMAKPKPAAVSSANTGDTPVAAQTETAEKQETPA